MTCIRNKINVFWLDLTTCMQLQNSLEFKLRKIQLCNIKNKYNKNGFSRVLNVPEIILKVFLEQSFLNFEKNQFLQEHKHALPLKMFCQFGLAV